MSHVDERGYFGEFGGSFVPEMLHANVAELASRYREALDDPAFRAEYRALLTDYVGRPSPLYRAERLSKARGFRVFLKREDLNHTGSHKINNTLGQVLLARRLGKKRIIAETGAGQHGLAVATVCAKMGMKCLVYMGAVDVERQAPNVDRMRLLGAEVVAVESGSRVLKDAVNEALRDWISKPEETFYVLGSAVGPHPYPDLVASLQSVISEELREQLAQRYELDHPDYVVACVGGGSNAIGAFYHYLDEPRTKLVGVEAGGCGLNSGRSAATLALGRPGVLHGSRTMVLQTADGQIEEAHSISAGLDYPGVGPQHAHLHATGRVRYESATDEEALEVALELVNLEGIVPALESAHALAYLKHLEAGPEDNVVLILSGSGAKDIDLYLREKERLDAQ